MKNYYATFGIGHELADHYQPILATNKADAEKSMFEKHGRNWAFVYGDKSKVAGKTALETI